MSADALAALGPPGRFHGETGVGRSQYSSLRFLWRKVAAAQGREQGEVELIICINHCS